MHFEDLKETDIYLVDQLFKGRIIPGQSVLDVGCGSGRNLIALGKMGCELYGVDINPDAIAHCSMVLNSFQTDHFFVGDVCDSPFKNEFFDVVICNALFHFATDLEQFQAWSNQAWRKLKPGGIFFARLSTRIGLPDANPPGFTFLATEQDLVDCEKRWNGDRLDPLKTTLVESARTMTTWVLQK